MKQQLRQIYEDLSTGKITREDALARIKALRQIEQESGYATLLFAPVWRDAVLSQDTAAPGATEHHVLLCGVPPLGAHLPQSRVAELPPLHEDELGRRYSQAAAALFERIQDLFRRKRQGRVLLQLVIAEDEEQSLLVGLSGLLKTAALENPALTGQIVLVPRDVPGDVMAHWLELERRAGAAAVVRYGRGVRQLLQWKEIETPAAAAPIAFREGGVYLITGGLGRLGTLFARELIGRTSESRVILTGRGDVSSGWFSETGRVTYRQVDLADMASVGRLVASIREEHGRLDGILHCAGMTADEFILKKTPADFLRVLEPKVTGTVHLDRATRDDELDFFVLFSSIAAAVGNAGQSDYATANAFLDRFAAYRNALVAAGRRHGRTRSLQWPLWQSGGMQLDPVLLDRWQQQTGVRPMRTAEGLAAFHRALALPHDQFLVVEGSADAMRSAFLDRPARQPERLDASGPVAADCDALVAKAEEFLRTEFAAILKLPAQKIDPAVALEQYGIDSILAMRLTGQLEQTFGTLSKTLFFEYQTVRELAGYFLDSYAARLTALFATPASEAATVQASVPVPLKRGASLPVRRAGHRRVDVSPLAPAPPERIAIIGISGRYPEAPDLEAYWQNLRDGKDCVTEVPLERWDWREYFTEDRTQPGSHYSRWGGFITGVDEFDPLFFNIAPKEAKYIDPQERLFLQHAWMAIEDAGYTRAALQIPAERDLPAQAGVYAGVMYNEYPLFGAESSVQGKRMGIPGSVASIANRVSYVFNLHGPSMTVDTMCSSSLTAIHLACEDLRRGRTNLGIAGGVNVTVHPNKYLALSAGQFISGDGHCQSFGDGGDGYIPGEGVGVVVLKRLSDAKRDGDRIYAVIRGSALNHGGKTNGFTVPNPQAQAAAIARALAESDSDPRHISYIEAHGTGTKLGDPIEIAALTKAFQLSTRDTGFCLIGSAKSNIGHCESAAGVAGVTKVLLQLQHQEIVPSLHSARLNPHIDFERTPFIVNQTLRPWEQPVVEGRTLPRIAGISSFGAGGSNAHLIVEEYRVHRETPVQEADVVIVLSARTPGQLREKAGDLLRFVRARRTTIDLLSVAWTLQAGREAMDERLAFAAPSIDELLRVLEAYVHGDGAAVQQGRRGRAASADQIAEWIAQRASAKLAAAWVNGAEIDWKVLYTVIPERIALPAYPFAKERYWIDAAPKQLSAPLLHPLLHANTSDLHEQRFTSTFSGREPFLVERGERKLLPAVACLEMARAAVERALPERPSAIELRDVTWTGPVVVDANAPVSIALFATEDGLGFEIYRRDGDEELLHCEGRAVALGGVAATMSAANDWVIPAALESAFDAVPLSLQSVRIDGACDGEPVVRGRGSDVDVCDARGNVRIALRGLRYETQVVPATETTAVTAPREAREIALPEAATPAHGSSAVRLFDRGNGILAIELAPPASLPRTRQAIDRAHEESSLRVLTIRGLEHLGPADVEQLRETVESSRCPVIAIAGGGLTGTGFLFAALCDFVVCSEEARYGLPAVAGGVASLLVARFGQANGESLLRPPGERTGRELREQGFTCAIVPAAEVEAHANGLAASLASKPPHAVQILKEHLSSSAAPPVGVRSGEPRILTLDGDAHVDEIRALVAASEVPVIAALPNGANATTWLAALLCDAVVYSRTATYSTAGMTHDAQLAPVAAALFPLRLGQAGREVLLTAGTWTGAELERRIGAITVADDVVTAAKAITSTARVDEALRQLQPWTLDETSVAEITESTTVALQSHVVRATLHPGGIAIIRMEDREGKNVFNAALMEGLEEAFARVENDPACKVAVLTGYGHYFASGGTKESLLAIHAGRAKFTDSRIFRLPFDCSLPVIAAMQGHGIGAGWSLGMFADLAVLSEESRYVSPYMDYGFTPGAGATWSLPARLGNDLARESLFTAQPITGLALRQRGLRLPVLPRGDVEAAAMALARQVVQTPRAQLVALKRQWSAAASEALEETLRRELAMHEVTFVGQADTLARIERSFGEEAAPAPQPAAQPARSSHTLPAVAATLKTLLAAELQLQESDIGEETQFIDLGLDSISGVSWLRRINQRYGTSIEATKVYSHPTLAELSHYVLAQVEAAGAATAVEDAPAPAPRHIAAAVPDPPPPIVTEVRTPRRKRSSRRALAAPQRKRHAEPVAIIGMAGQFPRANDLDEFWRNLAEGRDCISAVPAQRWDVDKFYQAGAAAPGKTNSRWVGALDHYDRFDPLFFNISPTEAEFMDPQQRLFLETCWHSIEHAGYDASTLSGSKCGVFVGCAAGDYQELSRRHRLSAQGFTGNAASILAARISYFLNLQGPCMSIDTACSSSLVAIAQACDSLAAGDSDLALAGGVYVMAGPEMHIRTAQAGMLSPEGRCFTFDQRADGFVPGEGVGVVVLKRLADAEREGDVIYGLVEGWGINQDGRTNGITAPNPESQTRLIRDVHEKFGIDPAGIGLVEAHGTGTKLGDPIEVEGLKAAFGHNEKQACAIGSVKSNIGHCLTAAGIAGTLKVVLALQHSQLPPTIHFERLNEHIDLSDSPFFVNTRLVPWPAKEAAPRRAAISSFGFSGTNAHLVVGDYDSMQRAVPVVPDGPSIVPLSAKTVAQLQQKARDLVAFLGSTPRSLTDVAYTLQVGREAMDERVAFVVVSTEDLVRQLQSWLDGGSAHRGHARRDKESLASLGSEVVDSWVTSRQLDELAEAWTKGLRLDWMRLYRDAKPRRIALPVYPFAKERYWIGVVDQDVAPVLHPLLHANASDVHHLRFRSTFSGSEPFLHQKTLTAATCLEMARAAVERALPKRMDGATLELAEITWGQPLVVLQPTDVDIALAAEGNEAVVFEIYSANEVVHCRGRATVRTDIPSVAQPSGTQLRLGAATSGGDFVLDPVLLDAALRGGAAKHVPYTLDSLRIHGRCSDEGTAWVRGDAARMDIDVCDASGEVRIALRGLSVRAADESAVVVAIPEWRAIARPAASSTKAAERHVLLCDLPQIDALPQTRVTMLQGDVRQSLAERYTQHALACFEQLQAIAKTEARLLVQVVASEELYSGLAALLRTASLEHARLGTQLILVPAGITADALHALLRDEEQRLDPVVRYTRGMREVLCWSEVADTPAERPAFREDAVYLITGGLGGLGTIFATEILRTTQTARVILTGRAAEGRLDQFASHPGRAAYRTLDLQDAAGVHGLVGEIVREYGRLDGVLHCAGTTADNVLARKTVAEFVLVLAPKVTGTANLDEATRDVALDFFVLFSSIASATGNAGQGDYAAANGFMDAFAVWRNAQVAAKQRHGRTRAIHWPLWQSGGMALDRTAQELVRQTVGAEPMSTATGLQTFRQSLSLACDEMLVLEGNRPRIHNYLRKSRLFGPAGQAAAHESAIAIPELQQQLKTALAGVVGIHDAAIELDRPFSELGLDSFLGAELIVTINKRYGTDLSQSRLFDYTTVRELAAFLDEELRQRSVPEPAVPHGGVQVEALPVLERKLLSRRARPRGGAVEGIAVIGMSGRYPRAGDLQQFWTNLATGRNSITEVPISRWDVNRYYDPDRTKKEKTYSKWIGAIDDHDRFDPLFFRISPQEADYMDPQHRLFLEESYHAFEDAGYSSATLSNEKCGVYLGITTNEYMSMIAKQGVLSAPVTSNSYAIAAARIAYYLNLKGPAISVDTACSSSLVSLHLACQALRNGEIDMALAGGVTLWLTPGSYVAMSQAGMFSPDGQCKTFDDSANGIVNGEGVGAVVLKRLTDAERDGDAIYGVILASGINQDGRTNGITAPSVNSQIELERSVYEQHGIHPDTITYVEMHGTGTKLGDPIELEALSTVFQEKTSRRNFCALGSVKSNIGHTTAAAGVAGLQKVLLSMVHRTLVATLNVKQENARFDFARSPFYVSREAKAWEVPAGTPRRAAVSSFGFSGTNAHVVVEEYGGPSVVPAPLTAPMAVPLSARTPEQLLQKAKALLAHLQSAEEPLALAPVAWTLQTGREAMEERLAIIASSTTELMGKLGTWIGGERMAGVARGRVEPDDDAVNLVEHDDDMREAVERWITRRKLEPLVDLWVRGLDVDWSRLHGEEKPRRVRLPLYPFAKQRCWIGDTAPEYDERAIAANDGVILDADVEAVERIIDAIANEAIDPRQAANALRLLV